LISRSRTAEPPALPQGFDYHPGFLVARDAELLLQCLWSELDWRQDSIVLFGRRVQQPRLSAWLGDAGARYRYSGLSLEPLPWNPALRGLRHALESRLGRPFNSVLVNAYRDGRDSMGWHADDEPELGQEPVIASVSLGACRRFVVRRVQTRELTEFHLEHGSLLVMSGSSQAEFRHALPKTSRPCGLRINLTFRQISAQA
jgi:alkylated DNA repair dioxygenase AlkB